MWNDAFMILMESCGHEDKNIPYKCPSSSAVIFLHSLRDGIESIFSFIAYSWLSIKQTQVAKKNNQQTLSFAKKEKEEMNESFRPGGKSSMSMTISER